MSPTHSTRRNRFNTYRFLARNLITPISEIILLKEAFCGLPGTKLSKLKNLHSEVLTKFHWGRFMVFLNFAEQLDLTEEEWEQLFDFLVPISFAFPDLLRGSKGLKGAPSVHFDL